MSGQINWPEPSLITEVISEFQPDNTKYVGSSLCPLNTTKWNNSPKIISWDILGAGGGMTYATTLGANPRMVKMTPLKTKAMRTAYWKEFIRLDEDDLLSVRNVGTKDRQRAAEMLVMMAVNRLDNRLFTRMEWLIWQMFSGTLSINENGVIRSINYEIPGGNFVTASPLWSSYSDAHPVLDLQTWSQKFTDIGTELEVVYINQQTAIHLANNASVQALVRNYSTVLQIGANNVGALIMQLAGVPGRIEVYDKGYKDDSLTYNRFIPNGKAYLFAKHVEEQGPFAEFASTPSLYNGGIGGATGGRFVRTLDETQNIHKAHYDILMGLYGLPVMYHPEWVIVATVA